MNKLQGKISLLTTAFRMNCNGIDNGNDQKWLIDQLEQLFSEMLEEIIPDKYPMKGRKTEGRLAAFSFNQAVDIMRQKAKDLLK